MRKVFFQRSVLLAGALFAACFITTACSKKSKLPDLSSLGEINAVTREEGSGTRAEFESLINTQEKGADIISESTDEVLKTVASSKDSIGYVAYSAADANDKKSSSSAYKVLDVDGIKPSEKTISNGKYPLCRDYIVASKKEYTALEDDFMSYIMSKGQDIVGKYCIRKKKSATFLSDKAKGKLSIEGSSSVAPIMQELIDDYKKYNENAEIALKVSDSSSGLNAVIRGECDWAISSRSLKDYENELLQTKVIGSDAIAVIVNRDNPVTGLSIKQIKGVYDKDFEKWNDIK